MNKVTSFLLIIIIVYVSYDYCTRQVIEGAGNIGDYNKGQDNKSVKKTCKGPQLSVIDSQKGVDKCQYKNVSCKTALDNGTGKDNWTYGSGGEPHPEKINCMKCIQGSEVDSTSRRYLADIGYDVNTDTGRGRKSEFAYHVCDAMNAECDSYVWYANAHSDWYNQDCKGVTLTPPSNHSHSTIMMCTLLRNSFLQFFMSFLGGVTCTLKIKARELEQTITHALDEAEDSMKCASCKCGGILGHDKCDAAWKCCGEK